MTTLFMFGLFGLFAIIAKIFDGPIFKDQDKKK